MPYTIINAIEDEIKLLDEMEDWAKRNNKTVTEAIYGVQRDTLMHIVRRLKGYDYKIITDQNGKEILDMTKSNRKTLEEEYPALKKAAEQYDIIHNLVDSTPEE